MPVTGTAHEGGTGEHVTESTGERMTTRRLVMRPWQDADAEPALAVYGVEEVTRWLSPAMSRVPDPTTMRSVIQGWLAQELEAPQRRWAVELKETGELVGGAALLPLPPDGIDSEIGWQLAPTWWGRGFGAEAGHAVAHYAFERGVDELFAVVRPRNQRGAATAKSIGMEWVGETEKYYQLRLQVYRLRPGELDAPRIRDIRPPGS